MSRSDEILQPVSKAGFTGEEPKVLIFCVELGSVFRCRQRSILTPGRCYALLHFGEDLSLLKSRAENGKRIEFNDIVQFRVDMKKFESKKLRIRIVDGYGKRTEQVVGDTILSLDWQIMTLPNKTNSQSKNLNLRSNEPKGDEETCSKASCVCVLFEKVMEPVSAKDFALKGHNGHLNVSFWFRTWHEYLNTGFKRYMETSSVKLDSHHRLSKPKLLQYAPSLSYPLPVLSLEVNENRTTGMILRVFDGKRLQVFPTYQIRLAYLSEFFDGDRFQGWNKDYNCARQIFGDGASAAVIRAGIRKEFKNLYDKRKRMLGKGKRVFVQGMGDLLSQIGYRNSTYFSSPFYLKRGRAETHYTEFFLNPLKDIPFLGIYGGPLIDQFTTSKPQILFPQSKNRSLATKPHSKKFTYVISPIDNSFYFSETANSKLQIGQDFVSKHALLNNAVNHVVYAGEFFVDTKSEEVVSNKKLRIIFDNNSGTYAPEKYNLSRLRHLMEANFGTGSCVAFDREDQRLKHLKQINDIEE
mmetsp:Transcript_6959/g.8437  ORF Transcript_6959/g.8437 Transcript_6959/m.8437 type:complete len:525 (+) Transcript_6959:200-1774(+)